MTARNFLWSPPPAELALSSDEVHVWCASLEQPASSLRWLGQTLSADEQERAGRFHFERDRRHFIAGRGLLRTILGRYLRVEAERLQFCYGPRGKPSLLETCGGDTLCFNVSHSHGLALYAVTHGRKVGVDVEWMRPLDDIEQIAERFFSARENATFRALAPDQKVEAFFNCWTRKEAYIKATGDGLSRPLDEFDVSLAPGEPARLLHVASDPQEAARWLLRGLTPAPDYAAAVIVAGQDWRLACWQWVG
jgi:4'-phosphopantetheinyl transferase